MAKGIVSTLYRAGPVAGIVLCKSLGAVNSVDNGIALLNVVSK